MEGRVTFEYAMLFSFWREGERERTQCCIELYTAKDHEMTRNHYNIPSSTTLKSREEEDNNSGTSFLRY